MAFFSPPVVDKFWAQSSLFLVVSGFRENKLIEPRRTKTLEDLVREQLQSIRGVDRDTVDSPRNAPDSGA